MRHKYVFTALLLFILTFSCFLFTGAYVKQHRRDAKEQFTVVTSFYPMYIAAENIIGNSKAVTLKNLSEPQTGCMHDYQLTPEDMKLLSGADIFIINGGGIESFLPEVAEQHQELTILDASGEVELQGENAHAWMSVSDYSIQVQTILTGLQAAYPSEAESFAGNAAAYQKKLLALMEQQQEIADAAAGASVITFHEAYDYVAEDYGMNVCYTLDLDEERQVGAGEVAELLAATEDNGVSIVLAEALYGSKMGDMTEKESLAKVYYLDTLVRGDYDKNSYIDGMQGNINILKEAFGVE